MIRAIMDGRVYSIENKTSENGKEYTVASLRDSFKNSKGEWESRFVTIRAFGENGKTLQGMKAGTSVLVMGELSVSAWKDKENSPRANISMMVNSITRPTTDKVEATEAEEDVPVVQPKKLVKAGKAVFLDSED